MEEPTVPHFCHNKEIFDSPDSKVPAASTFLSLFSFKKRFRLSIATTPMFPVVAAVCCDTLFFREGNPFI